MTNYKDLPSFDELASFIAERFAKLRTPYMEWANALPCEQLLPWNVSTCPQS